MNTSMRRFHVLASLALAATLAVSVGACSEGSDDTETTTEADQVTYLTGFGAVGRDAFAWVAQEKGYFEEANIDVTIEPGAAVTENLKALAAGTAQFVTADLTGAWILAGTGEYTEFQTIMAVHQQNLVSIITFDDSGITVPKDLEGKSVAAAANSVNQLLFPAYAKLAGFDATKVTIVNVQSTQLAGALSSGQVQALSTQLVGQSGIEAKTGKKTVLMPFNTYLSDLYGNGTMTTDKIATENPDLVKRFRAALLKGLQYTIANPQEAAEILNRAEPGADVTSAVGEINSMIPYTGSESDIGMIDEERVARAIATLQANELIDPGMTPADVIDLDVATATS